MYGTGVCGDFLYVIGGNIQGKGDDPEGYVNTVEMARINPDGTLQNWIQTTPLPENRCYINNSTLVLNDIIYVVMGTDGRRRVSSKTIFWTRPQNDGHLEPWRESLPCPGEGLAHVTAVATPGYINVIGGIDTNKILHSEVWSAKIGPAGEILSWEKGYPMPGNLYFHCAGVAGGHVWVWGGLKDRSLTLNGAIFKAPVLGNGRIGPWSTAKSTLPNPFYNAAVTVSGDYLLSFGPRYTSSMYSSDVWYSQVGPGGTLSKWIRIPTDISPKLYIGAATDYRRNYVYIPGGRINQLEDERSLDSRVFVMKLGGGGAKTDSRAEPYHPAADDGNLSYMKQQTDKSLFRGFIPFSRARFMDKPMALYVHTKRARKCQEQKAILDKIDTSPWSGRVIFTELDMRDFPQISQQYGVFMAPSWIFFDSKGRIKHTETRILSDQEIRKFIQNITH